MMVTADDNSRRGTGSAHPDQEPARAGFVISRGMVGWALAVVVSVAVFIAAFRTLRDWPTAQNMRTADHRVAAMSLLKGEGLVTSRGETYGKSAPIYPVLLAGLRLLGLEWWTAASLINALAFAAGVLAVHGLARLLGLRTSRWLILAYLCFGPIYYLFREARPDVIYAVCGIGGVALASAYVHRRSVPLLVALAVVCSLAALSRYMAVFTLLPLAGVVILLSRHDTWSRKLMHAALFCIIAGGPIAGWLIRTERITGHYSGMDRWRDRKPADETLITFDNNVRFMARAFYLDFLAWEDFGQLNELKGTHPIEREGVVLPVAGLLAVILAGVAVVRRRAALDSVRTWLLRPGPPRTVMLVTGAYFILYEAMMLVLWTVGNNDPIDCRFLAPSYFMLVVLGATLLAVLWRGAPGLLPRGAVAAAVVGFLALQSWKTAATWEVVSDESASPWVEDVDQFVDAMGKTGLEARIEERLADRGRTKGIPAKMRERLENKGKALDPDEQKMSRVQNLAEQLRNDPTARQKAPDLAKPGKAKDQAAQTAERQARREAEARNRRSDRLAGSDARTAEAAESHAAESGAEEKPAILPNLEYVRLTSPPHWQPFVPAQPPPALRAAFHFGDAQRGKDPGIVRVFQLPARSAGDPDPFEPWLAGFVDEEDGKRLTPTSTELRIHAMPVRMVELTGTFRSDDPEDPDGTCSLIVAEISHPGATVLVVTLGQRKIIAEEQDAIVAFLMGAESIEPIAAPDVPAPQVADARSQARASAPAPDGESTVEEPDEEASDPTPPGDVATEANPSGDTTSASTRDSISPSASGDRESVSRFVSFAFEPPWDVYAPKNAGEGFRQGYFLDAQDRTRASAKLVVTYVARRSGDPGTQIARWLKDFTVLDEQVIREAPTPVRRRSGIPVILAEASGTYAPPTWATPSPDYAMLGAVIALPEGMYLVKATGPRPQMMAQRAMILAFIGSARTDAGEDMLMPEDQKPAERAQDAASQRTPDEAPRARLDDSGSLANRMPPQVPALEYITFTTPAPWPAFVPDEPNPNFRLGYVLAADRDDRPIAKITVGQAEGLCGTWDESVQKWLKAFTPSGGESSVLLSQEDLLIDDLPVLWVEVVGDYRPSNADEPERDTAMILAQIVHPQATYHLRAMGPAKFVLAERENILDFLRGLRRTDP
ncbi:MAG: hypothetical protein IT449_16820 [Phycisphaerales bacterium]|nr:hypothetical protein [Phycisphaerales bacterium]